jgi:hypothetical protein
MEMPSPGVTYCSSDVRKPLFADFLWGEDLMGTISKMKSSINFLSNEGFSHLRDKLCVETLTGRHLCEYLTYKVGGTSERLRETGGALRTGDFIASNPPGVDTHRVSSGVYDFSCDRISEVSQAWPDIPMIFARHCPDRELMPFQLDRFNVKEEIANTLSSLLGLGGKLFVGLSKYVKNKNRVLVGPCTVLEGLKHPFGVIGSFAPVDKRVIMTAIAVSIAASLAYWKWWQVQRGRFDEHGEKFNGSQTFPVCLHCNLGLASICTLRPGDAMIKRFHIPSRCARCSLVPFLHERKAVSFSINALEYQIISTYAELNKAKQRELHGSLANILDSSINYDQRQVFIANHLQRLHEFEDATNYWFCFPSYDTWTRSYRMATPWLPVFYASYEDAGITVFDYDMSKNLINKMRMIWTWCQNHEGQLPQAVIITGDTTRAEELITAKPRDEVDIFDRSEHLSILDTGSEPLVVGGLAQALVPPDGQYIQFISNIRAYQIGPILGLFLMYDTNYLRNKVTILVGRSKNKEIYDIKSDTARKIAVLYSCLNKAVLKKSTVDWAYQVVMDSCDGDILKLIPSKYNKDEVAKIMLGLETTCADKITKKALCLKGEILPTMKKYMRGVVNNGLELLALDIFVGKILSVIIFHRGSYAKRKNTHISNAGDLDQEHASSSAEQELGSTRNGIFALSSIKGSPRDKCLDAITSALSGGVPGHDLLVGEIDQTGMELHERCSKTGEGTLGHFLALLQKLTAMLATKLEGKLCGLAGARISYDIEKGMILTITDKNHKLIARFPDLYLGSGWYLTSLLNFLNEKFALYACHLSNPQRLFAYNNKTGRYRIEEGTHDHIYDSVALPVDEPILSGVALTVPASASPFAPSTVVRKVYFNDFVEGDDGVFRTDKIFKRFQKIIEANFAEIGFSSKLKYVADGRVEFIGVHFFAAGGSISKTVPWVPAIGRYLLKLGVNVSSNPSRAADVARCSALSVLFGGRIPAFSVMFSNIAADIIKRHKLSVAQEVKIEDYTVESKVCEVGFATLGTLVAMSELAANLPGPDQTLQLRMLENSFELPPGVLQTHDLVKLNLLSLVITSVTDDEEVSTYFPAFAGYKEIHPAAFDISTMD